jgi:type III secretory pathway component EscT
MYALIAQYRELFAILGLAGVFVVGVFFGIGVGWLLLKRKAKSRVSHAIDSEIKSLQALHVLSLTSIETLKERNQKYRCMMEEVALHISKAVAALK